MSSTANIEKYKLDYEFCDDTIIHTTCLEGGQRITTPKTTWKREKKLGTGAFGTVWREREEQSGQLRAVKILTSLELNTREIESLVKLQDYPMYFVLFLGWFGDSHIIHIAMECIAYGDLSQYIKEHENKAAMEAKEISIQILSGMAILHGHEICHRDLKPQNILIASRLPIWVKITDFGISKHISGTSLRTNCGTPSYQAPEQLGLLPRKMMTRNQSYTKAIDLWALGAVIHEILTSKIPFLETYYDDMDSMVSTFETLTVSDCTGTIDTEEIYNYCRHFKFPIETLQQSGAVVEAIELVRSLMAANPKDRMSATEALDSRWFHGLGVLPSEIQLQSELQLLDVDVSLEDANQLLAEQNRDTIIDILHSPGLSEIWVMQYKAVSMEYLEVIKVLLKVIDINASFGPKNVSLLHMAAGEGHIAVMKLLLSRGAKINASAPSENGQTALHTASVDGRLDVMTLLLDWGANIDLSANTENGQTALHAASAGGHLDAMTL
ncbi:hypothetical protein Q9L58_010301, partial [Maublancomyces gigas]